jgi:wyosine [tRNA(Phe)-imidazoG37] synthetase (radical SAM superfamily)
MMDERPHAAKRAVVYGPGTRLSWRLGRSLGIDLLGSKEKYCSFDCIYCELGEGRLHVVRRREFVTTAEIKKAMEAVQITDFDYVTFSGSGEPALASNLGEAIGIAREVFNKPVAVLTNASLMPRDDVRGEMTKADFVIAKIDAPDDELYRRINRPWVRTPLRDIIGALEIFRNHFRGKFALQMMFIEANKPAAAAMARIALEIEADEVQLCTPLRDCPEPTLSPAEMARIKKAFTGVKGVRMVYDER